MSSSRRPHLLLYYLNTLVANKRILKRSLVISMSVKMHQTAKGYLNIIELLKKSVKHICIFEMPQKEMTRKLNLYHWIHLQTMIKN